MSTEGTARVLDIFRGPFQPLQYCDSVIKWPIPNLSQDLTAYSTSLNISIQQLNKLLRVDSTCLHFSGTTSYNQNSTSIFP